MVVGFPEAGRPGKLEGSVVRSKGTDRHLGDRYLYTWLRTHHPHMAGTLNRDPLCHFDLGTETFQFSLRYFNLWAVALQFLLGDF